MRILSPFPALLLTATALSACSMAPKYERPATPVPPFWPVGDAYLRQSEAALPTVRYTDIFRDARLQRLIEQALVNNRDLRVAAANIAATRAQYRIQRASLLPNVSANGRYSYTDRGSGGAGLLRRPRRRGADRPEVEGELQAVRRGGPVARQLAAGHDGRRHGARPVRLAQQLAR